MAFISLRGLNPEREHGRLGVEADHYLPLRTPEPLTKLLLAHLS
ncbi:hypothetical protein OG863_39055 [Streptomyces decoyicus]|uniref:Uncharacterized protein n=1 Tax=Streptomyces decoyicus TaxID=249567 RepID=A0ABZ1FSN5_9ACTN|nr:hypothetical protein [Streptomyces decoyicus]WSB73464.1 hypothetical protein OG863_39055 [Streptomyces decoyicus]